LRQISTDSLNEKLKAPVAQIRIDCRSPKIDIRIDKDPCCPKMFKARVTAAIKSFTKGKKWRGR
jgi:hypothetical protein